MVQLQMKISFATCIVPTCVSKASALAPAGPEYVQEMATFPASKAPFGTIPFGNKLRDYFSEFESSRGHINAIVESLYRGQDELRRDNGATDQEKVNLWETMKKLKQYVYVGKGIDKALSEKILQIEASSHAAQQRETGGLR